MCTLCVHSHLRAVQKAHAQARHDIDATALDPDVLGDDFDFVVFNFPHVGSDTGLVTFTASAPGYIALALAKPPNLLHVGF